MPEEINKSLDWEVIDFDTEGPDSELALEAIEKHEETFGKGSKRRKMLVSKGLTLKELYNMSQPEEGTDNV
jgi:hypothetical protein